MKKNTHGLSHQKKLDYYTDKTGDCWEWTGLLNDNGYGKIYINGKLESAHRIAWRLGRGGIKDNLHVLHKCDNRKCVNPDHLFLGTNNDNIRDKVNKNRQPHGEGVYCAKLNDGSVLEIKRRVANGESQTKLAEEYGVTQVAVGHVIGGRTWKHLLEVKDV